MRIIACYMVKELPNKQLEMSIKSIKDVVDFIIVQSENKSNDNDSKNFCNLSEKIFLMYSILTGKVKDVGFGVFRNELIHSVRVFGFEDNEDVWILNPDEDHVFYKNINILRNIIKSNSGADSFRFRYYNLYNLNDKLHTISLKNKPKDFMTFLFAFKYNKSLRFSGKVHETLYGLKNTLISYDIEAVHLGTLRSDKETLKHFIKFERLKGNKGTNDEIIGKLIESKQVPENLKNIMTWRRGGSLIPFEKELPDFIQYKQLES